MKNFVRLSIVFILVLAINSITFAFTMSPSSQKLTINPGEEYGFDINMKPQGPELGKDINLILEIGGRTFDENGKSIILTGEELENERPYSVSDWVTIQGPKTQTTADEAGVDFPVIIKVPEDASPGTYYATVIGQSQEVEAVEIQGTGTSIQAKGMGTLTITVPGEADEEATLTTFELNEDKYEKGVIEFISKIKNEGNYEIVPVGTIKIYDENNEQLKDVVVETKELANGTKAISSSEDFIKFNPDLKPIPVNSEGIIATTWNNANINPGNYLAKLNATYGVSGELKEEIEFEVKKGLVITEFNTNYWNQGLPVEFNAKVKNNGTTALTPSGKLQIKDMWGNVISTNSINNINLNSGEEKQLQNLKWDEGFALGIYSADLAITAIDDGPKNIESVNFAVINWWQLIIFIIIVALIVFVIYKGVKKYFTAMNKLEKFEQKK